MVAVVGVPFLLLVLLAAPDWATAVLVAAMCAIGAWELLHAVGATGRGLTVLTVVAAVCVPYDGAVSTAMLSDVVRPLLVLLAFTVAIVRHGKPNAPRFSDVMAALFAGCILPAMLGTLITLRTVPVVGKAMVFVPLCISFGSDTFALFAGMAFGRHKLAPLVSPKKTVEGAVGGLLGGVLGMLLIRWIGLLTLDAEICTVFQALMLGLLGSVVGQIGDLSFSVIKREFGVKDYGKLLPGHGGILDRFDSVSFVAPFVTIAWFLRDVWTI